VALQDALNSIRAGKNIPGVIAEAERRIAQWHQQHDGEVAQLERELASCQSRNGIITALQIAPPAEERTPEVRLQELLEKLPPAQLHSALAEINKLKSVSVDTRMLVHGSVTVRIVQHTAVNLSTRRAIHDTVVSNPQKVDLDRRRKDIMCTAFGKNIAGFPGVCR
jgi:hypothetical protein